MSHTVGDAYKINCPHCQKENTSILEIGKVALGGVTRFTKECIFCGKVMYIRAHYAVKTNAFTDDPAKSEKV